MGGITERAGIPFGFISGGDFQAAGIDALAQVLRFEIPGVCNFADIDAARWPFDDAVIKLGRV